MLLERQRTNKNTTKTQSKANKTYLKKKLESLESPESSEKKLT